MFRMRRRGFWAVGSGWGIKEGLSVRLVKMAVVIGLICYNTTISAPTNEPSGYFVGRNVPPSRPQISAPPSP